ncbi:MAG: hypothetical protein JXD23_06675 [Spirochaetales bacterium]|nr:hypothetical protein [Spirochaetales bacterium]
MIAIYLKINVYEISILSDQQPQALTTAPGAIGSLIMGIISLATSFVFTGIVFAIIGMVLSGKNNRGVKPT